jgi:hypothetical protein
MKRAPKAKVDLRVARALAVFPVRAAVAADVPAVAGAMAAGAAMAVAAARAAAAGIAFPTKITANPRDSRASLAGKVCPSS